MYLQDTDFIPDQSSFRGRPQKPLLILQDFLRRNRQVMEVVFTRFEYKDAASCRSTFAKAIKYHHLEKLSNTYLQYLHLELYLHHRNDSLQKVI